MGYIERLLKKIGGIALFMIAFLAFYSSRVYNIAISQSNIELIYNTLILIFINEIDEQLHKLLNVLMPKWLRKTHTEIKKSFSLGKDDIKVLLRRVGKLEKNKQREMDKWAITKN